MSNSVVIVVDDRQDKIIGFEDTLKELQIVEENIGIITGDVYFEEELSRLLKNVYAKGKNPVIVLDEDLEGEFGSDIIDLLLAEEILRECIIVPFSRYSQDDQRDRLEFIVRKYLEVKDVNIVLAEGNEADDILKACDVFLEKENLQEGPKGIELG